MGISKTAPSVQLSREIRSRQPAIVPRHEMRLLGAMLGFGEGSPANGD